MGPMTSGLLHGTEDGWFSAEISDAAFPPTRASSSRASSGVVGVTVSGKR